jgi:hypothetical protein
MRAFASAARTSARSSAERVVTVVAGSRSSPRARSAAADSAFFTTGAGDGDDPCLQAIAVTTSRPASAFVALSHHPFRCNAVSFHARRMSLRARHATTRAVRGSILLPTLARFTREAIEGGRANCRNVTVRAWTSGGKASGGRNQVAAPERSGGGTMLSCRTSSRYSSRWLSGSRCSRRAASAPSGTVMPTRIGLVSSSSAGACVIAAEDRSPRRGGPGAEAKSRRLAQRGSSARTRRRR